MVSALPISVWVKELIDKHYAAQPLLLEVLLTHSCQVAARALKVCTERKDLLLDTQFVVDASLLHDVGIIFCQANSIHCHGTEPYMKHGLLGGALLRREGVDERYARVCERHTGAGLTQKDVEQQRLPLPKQDWMPETLEEKLICYADNFYSKSRLDHCKSPEQVLATLRHFGAEGAARFVEWHRLFEGAAAP